MTAKSRLRGLALALGVMGIPLSVGEASSYVVTSCDFDGNPTLVDGLAVACGGKFNLCRYVDEHGQQAISGDFEVARAFSDGLAAVRIDGRYGYIDHTGKLVVPARFEQVGQFAAGLAEVVLDGRAGVIDRQGKLVVEANYARALPFGEHSVFLKEVSPEEGERERYRWHACPSLLDAASTLDLDKIAMRPPSYRLLDLPTGSSSSATYRLRYFDDFDRGFIWAGIAEAGTPLRFGLLKPDGTWQIAPQFDDVSRVFNGFATVCDVKGDGRDPSKDRTCGAVDREGHLAVPVRFEGAFDWRSGLKLVGNRDRMGLVDLTGKLLGGRYFDEVRRTEAGDIYLVRIGRDWMGLDRTGKTVANPEDGKLISECPSGLRAEKRSGKVRIVDANGNATGPYLFENTYMTLACDQPTPVNRDGKWGFIDPRGRWLTGLPAFDFSGEFRNGYAAVELDSKWGIVDTLGRYSVEPRFDELYSDDEAFAVALAGRRFWIDAKGTEIPEPSRAENRAAVLTCGADGGRLIAVDRAGETLWGLADADGEVFVEPMYRALRCYANGVAWVANDDRRMWCQIDRKGVVRDPAGCDPTFRGRIIFDARFEELSDDPYESGVLWEHALLDYGRGVRTHPPRIVSGMRF